MDLENPWPTNGAGDTIRAENCWACSKPLTDPACVVDAVSPKVVHDAEPCKSALEPL